MDLDKAIKERRSARKFKSKKPDWRDIIEAIDSMRYAPMAGNLFTLKFILIDDKEKIQKIADCCQQNFIAQAHYIVIVCSDPKMLINAYENKGEIYCRQQAGAAIQNFLLKIEEKKLATCWVGYFEENMVKRELKIPAGINVEAVFPIGYEQGKTLKRRKIELDACLFFNEYKNKHMKKPGKINV